MRSSSTFIRKRTRTSDSIYLQTSTMNSNNNAGVGGTSGPPNASGGPPTPKPEHGLPRVLAALNFEHEASSKDLGIGLSTYQPCEHC